MAPSIPLLTVAPSIIAAAHAIKLDLTENNYRAWAHENTHTLRLCGLGGYIDGRIVCPDRSSDPVGHNNWISNNESIIALFSLRAVQEERRFIDPATTAREAWDALRARHEQQGPLTQITLIEQAFAARYSTEERFATTSHRLTELVGRIWAIGIPTQDMFLAIVMLNALRDFSGVRDHIATSLSKPQSGTDPVLTSDAIRARLDYQQQIVDRDRAVSSTPDALAVQPVRTKSTLICSHCKGHGHLVASCWAEGGPMEGRRDEVLAAKKARKTGKGKGGAPSTTSTSGARPAHVTKRYDQDGRAYLLDNATGTAFFV
ncbi:hypothetical protein NEOLEDRAFT_1080432, partial [Neolentinus lepideus HHB14362 ss-1]